MFFDQVLAFDHVKKEIHLIVTADLTRDGEPDKSSTPETSDVGAPETAGAGAPFMRSHRMSGVKDINAAYAHALKRLHRLEKRLARALPKPKKKHAHGKLQLTARTPKPAFLKSVD